LLSPSRIEPISRPLMRCSSRTAPKASRNMRIRAWAWATLSAISVQFGRGGLRHAQKFDPVADRAQRVDKVMADARAEKRGQIVRARCVCSGPRGW
jgi:hypothetical protein